MAADSSARLQCGVQTQKTVWLVDEKVEAAIAVPRAAAAGDVHQ
jgi:hypothetical protein